MCGVGWFGVPASEGAVGVFDDSLFPESASMGVVEVDLPVQGGKEACPGRVAGEFTAVAGGC